VELITTIDVAALPSKVTADVPVRPVPVTVNAVPPPDEPFTTYNDVIVGAAKVLIEFEAADDADVPALFVAVTVNV
jgi:hypothetical protein